jgi:asparaginyl-tRNA synthetase
MNTRSLKSKIGEIITLNGWLVNNRNSGKIGFIQFRDGVDTIQVVYRKNDFSETEYKELEKLNIETAIRVTGKIKETDKSVLGYEMVLEKYEIVGLSGDEYPISLKEHGTEFLMDNRHLWLRTAKQSAIMRVRDHLMREVYNFFHSEGFYNTSAPIITSTFAEDSTELFKFDYFGKDGYLSQSGQLYGEVAAMALGKIYTFGPTFRSEKSRTRKHLTEFWMIEPEMAYFDHEMSLEIQERFVEHLVQSTLEKCKRELEILERDTTILEKIKAPFPRINYSDGIKKLNELGYDDIKYGDDYGTSHEKAIAALYEKPVFITNWPAKIKAFYMQPDPNNAELVKCADLIAGEGYGEIIGGSERISDYKLLEEKMGDEQLSEEDYYWYLDLRRYGSVPHSGFGLGFERAVSWICGLEHIRESIPFPRLTNRIKP